MMQQRSTAASNTKSSLETMTGKNLQLVSARIDPDTLALIDKWLTTHRYWKRNAVINGILTAVMNTFTEKEVYDMVRYSPYYYEKASGTFSLNDKRKV